MNLTNFLLATTSLLLVVAFALSFGGFTKNINSDASTSQRDEIKAKIAQAEEEARRLELAALRRQNSITPSYIAPATTQAAPIIAPSPVVEPTPIAQTDQDLLDSLTQQLGDATSRIEELEDENMGHESEIEEIHAERTERRTQTNMEAFKIRNATTMGTVKSANKENALVIFSPSPTAPALENGAIYAVRRNDGIIGKVRLDRHDITGDYVATMRPHGYSADGYPDIQPGDTIIYDHSE